MTGPAPPSFSELAAEILRFDEQQQDFPIHSHDCNGGSDSMGPSRLEDVFTRFRLWVGNLGVLHKRQDPRGLDKRLQDAPEVAKRIRELLAELKDLLREAKQPCKCNSPQTHVAPESVPTSEEDALIMQLLGIETSSGCTVSWLLASLESTVRRLFTISSLIAKSTTRDKFARAEVNCRLQMYELHDISHVREKLKQKLIGNEEDGEKKERLEAELQANEWLANRLGRANTKRRQFIAYSQSHRDALNKELINDSTRFETAMEVPTRIPGHDNASVGRSACFSEGVKSSIARTKASTVADLDPNVFDYGQDDARSTTTVATSIMDGQSFSGLKVPQLVHFTEVGEHFVCPLCRTFQRFNGQEAWSKHVFSDIRAYICTSKDCGMSMFDSFSTWRGHEMEHRRRWSCPLCSTPCTGEATTEAHLMQIHNDTVGPHNIDTLLRTSSHPSEFLLASDCPFCDWNAALRKRNPTANGWELSVPSKRFLKHLGRHLEELALFVVPQPEQDDDDSDQVGSNAVHAAEADDDATMSTLSSFSSKVSATEESLPRDASSTVPTDSAEAGAKTRRRSFSEIPHEALQDDVEGHEDGTNSKLHRQVKRGDPPQAHDGKYYCNFAPECFEHYFDRKHEWRCPQPQCAKLKGFTSSSGLVRHEREVHTKHGGPREVLKCPIGDCKRHVGKDFSRMDGLVKHLAAVHGIKKSPAEIRRDRSLQSGSVGQEESQQSTDEHNHHGQGPDTALQDYQTELMIREQQNKKRSVMERQGHDRESTNPNTLISTPIGTKFKQDYNMQLELLDRQNEKRLHMVQQMVQQGQDLMEPQGMPFVVPPAGMAQAIFDQHSAVERGQNPWDESKTIPGAEERNMRLAILGDRDKEVFIPPRQNPRHNGERLPGAHRILDGQPTALSEVQLEHTTVKASWNPYDEEPIETFDSNQTEWGSIGNFEDLPGEEVDRLFDDVSAAHRENIGSSQQMPLDNEPRLFDRSTSADRENNGAFERIWTDGERLLSNRLLHQHEQPLTPPSPSSSVGAVVAANEYNYMDNPGDRSAFDFNDVSRGIPDLRSQSVFSPTAPIHRPFRCDQCMKSFRRHDDLTRHKRLHVAAARPFACESCGKSFVRKHDLKRHVFHQGCGQLQELGHGGGDGDADVVADRTTAIDSEAIPLVK